MPEFVSAGKPLVKIGLVINPLAGIGGSVGLKGSDGLAIVEQAFARGARPLAEARALTAVSCLHGIRNISIYTAQDGMGADVCHKAQLEAEAVYAPAEKRTTAQDTHAAVLALCAKGIDLLVFAGGDGTARDVLNALEQAGKARTMPVVGIPAGCKIHSAVYAVSPQQAGELIAALVRGELLSVREAEVMDLDEDAFRHGEVKASCYGYMKVPVDEQRMQAMKQGGVDHEALALQDIAADIVEHMAADTLYLIGSGTTTAAIMDELGLDNTLLGIDAVYNNELIASDLNEQAIMSLLDQAEYTHAKIVVTAIGGQGHIFGRGNQQLSARVIRRVGNDNIIIVATREKLRSLNNKPLRVDTGDSQLDAELVGMKHIRTGYDQQTLYRVE